MTAHRDKPTITPERIAWFAAYHRRHPAWGAFHVALEDGNWRMGAWIESSRGDPGEAEAIEWFNRLTASQRKRLSKKCDPDA